MSHNKKRNTALLFEVLIKEQAKCILKKQDKKAKFIEKLIKKFFFKGSPLSKELELYTTLAETTNCSSEQAERLITNAKLARATISESVLYEMQSKLISLVNKTLGQHTFSNFVDNYKNLATINILFNDKAPFKTKMDMEQVLKESLTKQEKKEELITEEINMFIFKKYLENYNDEYVSLLDEQKELLNKFVLYKFGDEIDLKIYLNTECVRLSKVIDENIKNTDKDDVLYEKLNKTSENLKNMSIKHIDDTFIYSMLKYQELAKELNSNNG